MLKRTLEPEVMDSAQDASEYNRMGHATVNAQFVDDLLQFLADHGKRLRGRSDPLFDDLEDNDIIGSLLDVGTATARIPIELCKRNPEIRVMGIDLAASMLDLAIQNIDIAGFRNQIQLAQIDAKDSGYEDAMFDAVISNSMMHHILDPETAVAEAIRTTREGGVIFFRDLVRPGSADEVDALVENYAGDESAYSQSLFRASLHASLTLEEMRDLVVKYGGEPDSVTATSDRHWTWATIR